MKVYVERGKQFSNKLNTLWNKCKLQNIFIDTCINTFWYILFLVHNFIISIYFIQSFYLVFTFLSSHLSPVWFFLLRNFWNGQRLYLRIFYTRKKNDLKNAGDFTKLLFLFYFYFFHFHERYCITPNSTSTKFPSLFLKLSLVHLLQLICSL